MKEVTQKEFFELLKASCSVNNDIMPSHASPDFTLWLCQKTGKVFGKTLPGWKRCGLDPNQYFILENQSC